MGMREDILEALKMFEEDTKIEYVTVDQIMEWMPGGTDRHSTCTAITRIAKEGLLGKGELGGKGSGGKRKYKLLREPTAPILFENLEPPKEDGPPLVSFEHLGEAMYTRLVTLERKLSTTEEKLRDTEIKLREANQNHASDLRKLNATIKEQNDLIKNLHARVGNKKKSVPLSDIVHISKPQS